ncbi:MAG: short-chain dehydrogenase [Acidobacteria bacterium]|nr:MAG: short-chain dehydrogenase [Acidobacteriota bacterium]PYR77265.1 MAG: short-chain dehydrogenase [Acidobacteriota bacterium]
MQGCNVPSEPNVVLVTGASSGFGLLAAIGLAKRGCHVFAGVRSPDREALVHESASAAGTAVRTVRLDVTDARQIEQAVGDVLAAAGRIDVLVNNAGFGMGGFFEDITDEELRRQFDTNFFGLAAVTRAVLPGMRIRRSGRVINISSIAGRIAQPALSAYSASKFALEGLSESLRLELMLYGIDVVLIEPGTYKTDIWGRNRGFAQRAQDPSSPYYAMSQRLTTIVDRMVEKVGRDPAEVGELICRVATMTRRPRMRYTTGPNVRLELAMRRFIPEKLYEAGARRILRKLFADA